MQIIVPYSNNTEDNTITIYGQKIYDLQYYQFFAHRMILGEQVCALCAKFSNTQNRRLNESGLWALLWLHAAQ